MSIVLKTPDTLGLALVKYLESRFNLTGKEGWGSYLGKQVASTVMQPVAFLANLTATPVLSSLAILSSPLGLSEWGQQNIVKPLFTKAEQTAYAAARAATNTFVGNAEHYGDVVAQPVVELNEQPKELSRFERAQAFAKKQWKPLLGGAILLGGAVAAAYLLKSSPLPKNPLPKNKDLGICDWDENEDTCTLKDGLEWTRSNQNAPVTMELLGSQKEFNCEISNAEFINLELSDGRKVGPLPALLLTCTEKVVSCVKAFGRTQSEESVQSAQDYCIVTDEDCIMVDLYAAGLF